MKKFKIEKQENETYRIMKFCWVWYRWVWIQYGDVYGRLDKGVTEYRSREITANEINTKATGFFEIID